MSDPFVGEIRIMPYGGSGTGYIPRGWALCNGAIIPIQQNTALFALLGAQYGGNGTTTFALPNLMGRVPVGPGQGPGLTNYPQGAAAGTESVTLQLGQMPAHTHPVGGNVPVSNAGALSTTPQGGYYTTAPSEQYGETADHANMGSILTGTTAAAGGSTAHENRQPFLALNYFIATQGVFPQRQ